MYFRPLNSKCAFMNVQVINKSKHPLPAYATELSAGMDIRAIIFLNLSHWRHCSVAWWPQESILLFHKDLKLRFVPVADWPSKGYYRAQLSGND